MAARTIDWGGGPGAGPSAAQQPAGRVLLGRLSKKAIAPAPAESRPGEPLPTVDGKGIDPVVQMGMLEAELAGRSFEEVLETSPAGDVLAERDGGERLVVRLNDSLVNALAEAPLDQLRAAAVPWSETEEFWGDGDPEALGAFLIELSGLAQRANADGRHAYCWVSV